MLCMVQYFHIFFSPMPSADQEPPCCPCWDHLDFSTERFVGIFPSFPIVLLFGTWMNMRHVGIGISKLRKTGLLFDMLFCSPQKYHTIPIDSPDGFFHLVWQQNNLKPKTVLGEKPDVSRRFWVGSGRKEVTFANDHDVPQPGFMGTTPSPFPSWTASLKRRWMGHEKKGIWSVSHRWLMPVSAMGF